MKYYSLLSYSIFTLAHIAFFNKGFSSRFYVGSWVRHETPEEGRRTYHSKRGECNNEDEVNSPNILSDKNDNLLGEIYF